MAGLSPGEQAQAEFMRHIFTRISPHYDRVNRVISLGQDRRWRALAVRQLPTGPGLILDLASGTGEICMELAQEGRPVLAVDICEAMMLRAQGKAERLGLAGRINFLLSHALHLPFAANTFQGIIIGFALRDLPALDKVLTELYRVLKPKGKLVLLELTRPASLFISLIYGLYLFRVVPFIGRRLSNDGEAYSYFPRSLLSFPAAEALARLIERAGFNEVAFRRLGLGVVALHWGYK